MNDRGLHKMKSARRRWKKTSGEYFLRLAGFIIAFSAIYIGYMYSQEAMQRDSALQYSQAIQKKHSYIIKRGNPLLLKKVLLISASTDEPYQANIQALKEAVFSYYGADVTSLDILEYHPGMLSKYEGILILGNTEFKNKKIIRKLAEKVNSRGMPILWIGAGFPEVASLFGISHLDESPLQAADENIFIEYKGVAVPASGLMLVQTKISGKQSKFTELATLRISSNKHIPAIIRKNQLTYISFVPFTKDGYTLSLAITIDAMSGMLGKHKANPRVIFRLEDINADDYGASDTSFSKTVKYLESESVFTHLGIIPIFVNADGKFMADITDAKQVLKYIKNNPSMVAVVQHGTKHHRIDPRNHGKKSGDAYEYFLTDDVTLGRDVAQAFAIQRMTEGYNMLTRVGIKPEIFEAPHYELSPSEQKVASNLYPVMHHQPLFYLDKPMTLMLPWFTSRSSTIYAPSSIGYIDAFDKNSANNILSQLSDLGKIIPDPVVVIFFHPFMIEREGRKGDLKKLITGVKKLGYRFVSTFDELVTQ